MIEVDVLKAKDLAKYFYDIDKFEGTDYRRIWIPVTWNGQWFIGNIYEFQQE